ncbi:transporter substrate-binding domain-containing protein [Sphingomonas sp. KR1UV-12]|uniref:Transporter substrate-binding domain-containing protein n=1 Tax=Sphingomonas aurea TaxID=3063994 RepID=A0ABT9EIP4_9SPHN|nr:transporter substrate-binding domain-containing protein [Sphingomonas sp. KR1UV-12]MDP1026835.1 transporter substrate-binding domain-containing protein [Sphingomonas sp. KR1UV-12]
MTAGLRNVIGRFATAALLVAGLAGAGAAAAQSSPKPSNDVVREIAPGGVLRVAINYGNPVLAQKGKNGQAAGVSAALARALAKRLQTKIEFRSFDSAGDVVAALDGGRGWDVAFLAIDPKRGETIAYSAPYVLIEGSYMVPTNSPIRTNADVDRPGVRIAVGRNSAYDLYLGRHLRHAERVFSPTSAGAIALFQRERLDVAASVRQPLEAYAKGRTDVRLLPGHFMTIEQAVAVPKDRQAARAYVEAFVEEMKANGFVARELRRSGQTDATVAPPSR